MAVTFLQKCLTEKLWELKPGKYIIIYFLEIVFAQSSYLMITGQKSHNTFAKLAMESNRGGPVQINVK